MVEITEMELEIISDQIVEGYTSGRVDCENGKHVSWSLTTEAWINDDDKDNKLLNQDDHFSFIKRTYDMLELQKTEFGRELLRISGKFHMNLAKILCNIISNKEKEKYLYGFMVDMKEFPNNTIFSNDE